MQSHGMSRRMTRASRTNSERPQGRELVPPFACKTRARSGTRPLESPIPFGKRGLGGQVDVDETQIGERREARRRKRPRREVEIGEGDLEHTDGLGAIEEL